MGKIKIFGDFQDTHKKNFIVDFFSNLGLLSKEDMKLEDYDFDAYTSTIELVSIARFNVVWTSTV